MLERKYLAHYIDAAFNAEEPKYVRIGKNLEEYSEELNPDVEVTKNILGEQSVQHSGYEVQADVEPFYYESEEDKLSAKLMEIANNRSTGDACKTTMVDVLLKPSSALGGEGKPDVVWAYREDVYVIPNSVGGDTTGVQIPFTVYKAGNRIKGKTFDIENNTFDDGSEAV